MVPLYNYYIITLSLKTTPACHSKCYQNINLQVNLTVPAACFLIIVNPKLNHFFWAKNILPGYLVSHLTLFTAVRTLIPVAENTLFSVAVQKQVVCIVYEIWLYWNSTQYWTQNCVMVEYDCLYHRSSHPQLLQSVVDLDFQQFSSIPGLWLLHACFLFMLHVNPL